jgi:hypothetical protein
MVISHRHRCIFVHIPRTGGSSIENVIWPGERTEADLWMGFTSRYHNKYQTGGLQHLRASQIRQEIGSQIFDSYFKFAIVRDPWDRLVSQYSYMRGRPDLREFIGMSETDSFRTYLQLIQKRAHVQWAPQYDFLFDERGRALVDFTGRFERISQDADAIFSRVGLHGADLPHVNASARGEVREYYDDETAALVARIYARDIETFGYTF